VSLAELASQAMYERKDFGPTPIIKSPAVRRSETLPMLVTQFIHVHISFILDMINPHDRCVVLESQRDMGSLPTATTSARTHPKKVWDRGARLVDSWWIVVGSGERVSSRSFSNSDDRVDCDFYSAVTPKALAIQTEPCPTHLVPP
jgi:hypothetical protein